MYKGRNYVRFMRLLEAETMMTTITIITEAAQYIRLFLKDVNPYVMYFSKEEEQFLNEQDISSW